MTAPVGQAPVRLLAWVVAGLLVAGFGAWVAEGANRPRDPRLVEGRIPGFGEVAFRVQPAEGGSVVTAFCALLAATDAQRARGLMEVTDLAGYDGMVFQFPRSTTSAFFMRNTPMPLSIAWFAADGRFISSADMDPCPDRDGCPTYSPAAPYRFALEVPRGQLARLGIRAGSVLQLGGRCSPAGG